MQEPLKPKAPLTSSSTQRLAVTVKQNRKETKKLSDENELLRTQIAYLRNEIDRSSVLISDNGFSDDVSQIMDNSKITPFMKLFWDEQKKLFGKSKNGVKFHPMIIRYCLSHHVTRKDETVGYWCSLVYEHCGTIKITSDQPQDLTKRSSRS